MEKKHDLMGLMPRCGIFVIKTPTYQNAAVLAWEKK
jgi:hypothetical protein